MSADGDITACPGASAIDSQTVTPHQTDSEQNVEKTRKVRKVSFPDEEALVTQYFEPANPWQDVPSTTRAQLAAAYLEACRVHCTPPIDAVLQQIRELPENSIGGSTRAPRLVLSECALAGTAPADALETLLSKVQFRRVEIDCVQLDDEGAEAMFDMLEYYESATAVCISGPRQYGIRGWQAASRMIKKSAELIEMEISESPLEAGHASVLARSLRPLACRLRSLCLHQAQLSGEPLLNLVIALKSNSSIRELRLGDNGLTAQDASQLGSLLRYNTRIQLLDLSNNQIQDAGVAHIANALVNQAAQTPPSAAASPLSPHHVPLAGYDTRGLAFLVLWNNQLTWNCAQDLAKVLRSSQSLCVLNIGRNALGAQAVRALAGGGGVSGSGGGVSGCGALVSLGLQAARLGADAAVALGDLVRAATDLQRLDLRDNKLGVEGLQAICAAMKENNTLTQIDLDEPTETGTSVSAAARLTREIAAYCRRNEPAAPTAPDRLHRKISLTCHTASFIRPSPPEEERRSRLRSPAPSPSPSPAGSPVPAQHSHTHSHSHSHTHSHTHSHPHSHSRFCVTRVTPERESSTESSSSSSSAAARPTSSPSPSRFRVVQVAEPPKIQVHPASQPRKTRFSVTRNYDSMYNPTISPTLGSVPRPDSAMSDPGVPTTPGVYSTPGVKSDSEPPSTPDSVKSDPGVLITQEVYSTPRVKCDSETPSTPDSVKSDPGVLIAPGAKTDIEQPGTPDSVKSDPGVLFNPEVCNAPGAKSDSEQPGSPDSVKSDPGVPISPRVVHAPGLKPDKEHPSTSDGVKRDSEITVSKFSPQTIIGSTPINISRFVVSRPDIDPIGSKKKMAAKTSVRSNLPQKINNTRFTVSKPEFNSVLKTVDKVKTEPAKDETLDSKPTSERKDNIAMVLEVKYKDGTYMNVSTLNDNKPDNGAVNKDLGDNVNNNNKDKEILDSNKVQLNERCVVGATHRVFHVQPVHNPPRVDTDSLDENSIKNAPAVTDRSKIEAPSIEECDELAVKGTNSTKNLEFVNKSDIDSYSNRKDIKEVTSPTKKDNGKKLEVIQEVILPSNSDSTEKLKDVDEKVSTQNKNDPSYKLDVIDEAPIPDTAMKECNIINIVTETKSDTKTASQSMQLDNETKAAEKLLDVSDVKINEGDIIGDLRVKSDNKSVGSDSKSVSSANNEVHGDIGLVLSVTDTGKTVETDKCRDKDISVTKSLVDHTVCDKDSDSFKDKTEELSHNETISKVGDDTLLKTETKLVKNSLGVSETEIVDVNVQVTVNKETLCSVNAAKVLSDQNVDSVNISDVRKIDDRISVRDILDESVRMEDVGKVKKKDGAVIKQIEAITEDLGHLIQEMQDLSSKTKEVKNDSTQTDECITYKVPGSVTRDSVLKKNRSESSLDSPDLEVSRLMKRKPDSAFCDSSSSLEISGSSMESLNEVRKPMVIPESVESDTELDRRRGSYIASAESSIESTSDVTPVNILNLSVSSNESVSPIIFGGKKLHGSLSSLEASVSSLESRHEKVMVTSADSGIEYSLQNPSETKDDASSNEGTLTHNSSLKEGVKKDGGETLTSPKRTNSLLDVPAMKAKGLDRMRKISWVGPSASFHIPKQEPDRVEAKLQSNLEKLLSLFQHPSSLFSRSQSDDEKKSASNTPPRKDSSLTSSFWSWGSSTDKSEKEDKEDRDSLSEATDSTLSERVQVSFVDESFSKKLDSKTPSTDTDNTLSEFQSFHETDRENERESVVKVTDVTTDNNLVQKCLVLSVKSVSASSDGNVLPGACDNNDLIMPNDLNRNVYDTNASGGNAAVDSKQVLEVKLDDKVPEIIRPRTFAAVLKSGTENLQDKQPSPELGQPVDKLPRTVIAGIKEKISPENTLSNTSLAKELDKATVSVNPVWEKTELKADGNKIQNELAPIATIDETCDEAADNCIQLAFIDDLRIVDDDRIQEPQNHEKAIDKETVDLGKDALSYLIYENQDFEPGTEHSISDVRSQQESLAQELKDAEIKEQMLDLSPELILDEALEIPEVFTMDLKGMMTSIPERAKKKSNSLEDLSKRDEIEKDSPKTKTIAFKVPESTTPRDIPERRTKLRTRSGSSPKSLPESLNKPSPLAKMDTILSKKKKKVSSLGKIARDSLLALNMSEEEIAEFRRSYKLTSVESLKSLESVSEDANSQSGTSYDSRCRACLRLSQESLVSLDSITEDCRCLEDCDKRAGQSNR